MQIIQAVTRNRGWRITAAGAVILVLAGLAIPGTALAATAGRPTAVKPSRITPPPGAHCGSVTIIGARGSGQPYDTSGPFKGYGPVVYKAITIIESRLHAKKVTYSTESLKYPAVSVNKLSVSLLDFMLYGLQGYLTNHLDPFIASIATGVSEAENYAAWAQQTCHNSKIVMVGYSQGAMVMHQAELGLQKTNRAAYNLIIGTLLVADGNRLPKTKAREFGSSPATGEGIVSWLYSSLHLSQPYADVPLPGSTANVCNNEDLVCDTSLNAVLHFKDSGKVHTTSYAQCTGANKCTYYPALINGSTWVANLVASKV